MVESEAVRQWTNEWMPTRQIYINVEIVSWVREHEGGMKRQHKKAFKWLMSVHSFTIFAAADAVVGSSSIEQPKKKVGKEREKSCM